MPNSKPPASDDLEAIWAFLEKGIEHLMKNLPANSDSYAKNVALTTAVYNHCTSISITNTAPRTHTLMGAGLYNKLVQYFEAHLKGPRDHAESLQGEELLQFYAAEWYRYTHGAQKVDRIFMHLNSHWIKIKRERDKGRKEIYPVYTLARIKWKDTLFLPIHTKIAGAILQSIEDERNGSSIDEDLVKKIIDSFVSLGVDATVANKKCLDVYKEHFELAFINKTEKYYNQEAETFLASHSLSDYLKKVEERLREEETRVERYLDAQTREPLISKCERVFIQERSSLIWNGLQGFLDSGSEQDLQRIYSLLSRIPEGLDPLQKKFEECVEKIGRAAMSNLDGDAGSIDPKIYVNALLDIHHKNSEIVMRNFGGDSGFVESLDKAYREFINRNGVTNRELIVQYAELLLLEDNNPAGEGDLQLSLNRVMVLFKYLEGGDTLQTFYTTELSKRTTDGISSSIEREST